MRAADTEALRLRSLARELDKWTGLGMAVEDATDTRLTSVTLLNVETNAFKPLTDDLAEEATASAAFEVSRSGAGVNFVVIYLTSEDASVAPVLKRHGARPVDLSGAVGRPEVAAEQLRRRADESAASIETALDVYPTADVPYFHTIRTRTTRTHPGVSAAP